MEHQLTQPELWEQPELAISLLRERHYYQQIDTNLALLQRFVDEFSDLHDWCMEDSEEEDLSILLQEFVDEIDKLQEAELRLLPLLHTPLDDDPDQVALTIEANSSIETSILWVEELFRQLTQWIQPDDWVLTSYRSVGACCYGNAGHVLRMKHNPTGVSLFARHMDDRIFIIPCQ